MNVLPVTCSQPSLLGKRNLQNFSPNPNLPPPKKTASAGTHKSFQQKHRWNQEQTRILIDIFLKYVKNPEISFKIRIESSSLVTEHNITYKQVNTKKASLLRPNQNSNVISDSAVLRQLREAQSIQKNLISNLKWTPTYTQELIEHYIKKAENKPRIKLDTVAKDSRFVKLNSKHKDLVCSKLRTYLTCPIDTLNVKPETELFNLVTQAKTIFGRR